MMLATICQCAFVPRLGSTHVLPISSERLAFMLSKEDEMLSMGPKDLVDAVCRGLQDNDRIGQGDNVGFARLYRFMTPQGRTYMAPPPPRNGRLDGVSLEFFLDNACDPVFALLAATISRSSRPARYHRP